MIQLGKRTQRCALLAVAALGISSNALAQTPPAPPPDPAAPNAPPAPAPVPADPGAPATTPTPPPLPAEPPPPVAPPPVPAEPPKTTFPAMGGPFLRLNELFSFRPGLLLQFWAQAAQDQIPQANGDDGNFSKNMYMRRARFYLAGTLTPRITWTLLVESSNLGLSGNNATTMGVEKSFTTPSVGAPVSFGFNDAYMDLKINQNVSVQAGLMLIPFTRNILQSTATYWAIDIGAVSATYIGATQTNTLRDTGVQVKINGADNHFEARAMVSQGVKLPDSSGGGRSPGKNDPRFTGFLQYNFLDPDTGYVFNGQYFGKKRIAGVAVGADYQKLGEQNAYWATSATAFAAIPVGKIDLKNGGDEVGGQIEFLHYHPGRFPAPVTTFAKQNDLLVELGYYNKNAKMSVFGKFEGRFFDDDRILIPPDNKIDINDSRLYGGGLKYFLAEQLANLTLQYSYTQLPNKIAALPRNNTSLIQLQLQLAY